MTQIIPLEPRTSKVIPLNGERQAFNLTSFCKSYGAQTSAVFTRFLDDLYKQYTKTAHWKALPFPDQVESDYQFQLLRALIQYIGGSNHR